MPAQQITVFGGNLFDLAATYLQDASQAWRIAQRNSLTDYFLPGDVPTVLVIPSVDPTQTDGIPSQ